MLHYLRICQSIRLFTTQAGRYQRVKINNSHSLWNLIKHRVSKGSILDSIIFDIFFCDMFFMIDTMNIASYAGDNTLYDGEKTDKTEKQI